MGHPKKKSLEITREAKYIKSAINKNLKSVLGSFCWKCLKMDVKKADFDFWVFIRWFEAFTTQERRIKLEIPDPRP